MKTLISLSLSLLFCGLMSGQNLMTVADVFDYDIQDEFHYRSYIPNQTPNGRRITVLDKFYASGGDTVFYQMLIQAYSSSLTGGSPPQLNYTFTTDTIDIYYSNLDSTLYHYDPGFAHDTITSTDTCSNLLNGYNYCIGSFEPICYRKKYGAGLGVTESYHSDLGSSTGQSVMEDIRLIYYRKGSLSCGTPDTLGLASPQYRPFESITIYPNPIQSYLHIELKHGSELNRRLAIFDMQGQLLFEKSSVGSPAKIDLSSLPPGNYLLQLKGEGQFWRQPFVKK